MDMSYVGFISSPKRALKTYPKKEEHMKLQFMK